jgi:iron complex outermembrane receptor protein
LGVVLAGALPAHAQGSSSPPGQVQEIVVTGSAIRVTPDSVAVPVQTVSQDQIQQSGANGNALEVLRKALPAFQGRGNIGASNANNTNQNTGGGSQARLRDLDTLVLVNGRRVAVDAIAGVGGKIFVDVAQIPANAVQRVEVLEDGASAIYGSDAVGGVVNFILKQRQDGIDIGGRYGGASGGYSEGSAYVTAGTRLADRFDVVLGGSYNHTDPLYQHQRSFTHPFYVSGAAIPGAVNGAFVLAPSLSSPSQVVPTGTAATAASLAALPTVYTPGNATSIGNTYDLSQFQTLLLRQNMTAFTGSLTGELLKNDRLDVFSDFEYAKGDSFTQFLPRVQAVTVPAGAPYNPVTVALANVQFGDTDHPKQYDNTTEKFRITAGLRGRFELFRHGWEWETAFTHSQDQLNQRQANVFYGPNLALAIAGGYDASGNPVAGGRYSKVYSNFDTGSPLVLTPALDPFARNARNPATLANIIGTELISGRSILDSADLKFTGTAFTVPGGPVGVALGGAWRQESLAAGADLNGRNTGPTAQRWIGGQFFDPFSKSRDITGAFVEVRFPIAGPNYWNAPGLHALDLIAAGRFEHYSDAGDSTVPKVGLMWQPVDSQVTVRATYSQSFTAPSLYAEYGPTDTRQAGGAIIQGAFPGQPSSPFNAMDGNNPHLQRAKADIYSAGFTLRPHVLPDLHATLQYTHTSYLGIAGGIGFNNILVDVNKYGSASLFYNNVAKNNFPGMAGAVGFPNPGDLLAYLNANPGVNNLNLYAIDQFRNLGGLKLSTFDITVGYVWRTEKFGRFDLNMAATYLDSYQYQALPSQQFFEFAGVASNSPQAGGTQPKWRSYTTFTWTDGPWEATLAHNYISSVVDQGAGGLTFVNSGTPALKVGDYSTFDVRVAYTLEKTAWALKHTTLAVGVTNIGDRTPPYAPNAFPDNRADVATYSPIGRLIYATVDLSF